MKKVYIAGKYNDENIIKCLANIKLGIKAAVKAFHEGYIPFCPWLDFLFNLVGDVDLTNAQYKAYSMVWLDACDEIWLLPNWVDSGGAKAELERARELKLVEKYL